MANYSMFKLTLTNDEAFQFISAAINDDNKAAKELLGWISIRYRTLMIQNEELKKELAERKKED